MSAISTNTESWTGHTHTEIETHIKSRFGSLNTFFKGTCSTAAATTTKVVTCPEFESSDLVKGVIIMVTFDNTNSGAVASLKMNVNSTGDIPIKKFSTGAAPANLTAAAELGANQTKMFEYDGTNWVCMTTDYNSNDPGYYNYEYYPYELRSADYCGKYRILFTNTTHDTWVPGTTSNATNTTTARAVNQRPFNPFGRIVYYTGDAKAAGNALTYHFYKRYYMNLITLAYTFNVSGLSDANFLAQFTCPGAIYVKCAPQSDGSAIIDATTPLVQSLPSTNDGNIYILLGHCVVYDSVKRFMLYEEHPIYHYTGNGIKQWTNNPQLINITYADLRELRDNGNLVPGQQYRITDYICSTSYSNTLSGNHQFDIIVTADSESVLNENARAIHHDGDTYFTNCNLSAWELKYCLDNDSERFDWAQGDTGYGIKPSSSVEWMYYNNTTQVVDGVTYYMFGLTYGCTSPTPAVNDEWVALMGTMIMNSGTVYDVRLPQIGGTGVIYYMKDEYNNECPYDFKNIQYVINKSFKLSIWYGSNTSTYTYKYEDTGNTTTSGNTTYYQYDCTQQDFNGPNAPSSLYVTTNYPYTTMTLYSSPGTEWTGYMASQTWNYSIGNVNTSSGNYYTFGSYDNSINGYARNVKMNKYVKYQTDTLMTQLPNIYFTASAGDQLSNIVFEKGCFDIILGGQSISNISFGLGCNTISTFYGCCNITVGNGCSGISFGQLCYGIMIGDYCNNISIGKFSQGITIGEYCQSITIGQDNIGVTVGNKCQYITIGQENYGVMIGNYCNNIKFGDSSSVKNFYSNIVVEPGNKYIYLYCSATTSSSTPYRNVTIEQGVNNTTTWKTITDTNVNQTFTTTYQPANSQIITV